jgi:hypothetical protein
MVAATGRAADPGWAPWAAWLACCALVHASVRLQAIQATAARLTVAVDPTVTLDVSGFSNVEPRVMGVCSYGVRDNHVKTLGDSWLTDTGIETVGLTSSSFFLPPNASAWSDAQLVSWFDTHEAFVSVNSSGQAAALRQLQSLGVAPFFYIRGVLPGENRSFAPTWDPKTGKRFVGCAKQWKDCVPKDASLWGAVAGGMLRLLRQVSPELRQAHILNEVSSHWYQTNHTGSDYASFFLTAAEEIHSRAGPDLELSGPVLCCTPSGVPSNPVQADWHSYSKVLIDSGVPGGQLPFLDWHSYSTTPDHLLAELSLVTGYARTKHGRLLRSAITENNFALDDDAYRSPAEHYRLRTAPLAAVSLALLSAPDKIFARHVFNLISPVGNGTQSPRGAHDDTGLTMRQWWTLV